MHMESHNSSTSDKPLSTVIPYLPPELERLIFELAALDIGPKASTTLLLVAKRIHEWIRPLIFRVFNQMRRPPVPDFKKFPKLLESTGHLAEWLLVGSNPTASDYPLETLLSCCPNIIQFATWRDRIRRILPVVSKLPLRRLAANFDDFTYEDFLTEPLFVKLTHLDVLSFTGDTWDKHFEALAHLPNLTHLSIGSEIDTGVVSQSLRHCRLLQILIISPDYPYPYLENNAERLAEINDHRLVVLVSPPFPGLVHDWEKGAHGGIDYWAFSELVSLAQRRNYFVSLQPQSFPRVGFDWECHLNREGLEWFVGLHFHDPWPATTEEYSDDPYASD